MPRRNQTGPDREEFRARFETFAPRVEIWGLAQRELRALVYCSHVAAACPFCDLISRELLVESSLVVAFEDAYPVSPGHALIIPRRHVATYFDCTQAEKVAIWSLVYELRQLLDDRFHPHGFNVGFNAGRAAGQTVHHAHVHVIPRYDNDVADPRGGVRHAVVGRGYYEPKR